jgi:hypothetical protein
MVEQVAGLIERKGKTMTKRQLEPEKRQVPVLAIVVPHPTEPDSLMIQMNEETPADKRVDFCLACAQTFIGLAGALLDKERETVIQKPPSGILIPELHVRGPLQ